MAGGGVTQYSRFKFPKEPFVFCGVNFKSDLYSNLEEQVLKVLLPVLEVSVFPPSRSPTRELVQL